MTGKTFRRQVYLTLALLLLASFSTLWAGTLYETYADASRAAVPVYIAMAAAWLTFCLQRRVAYTNALRSLWERVVETIQDAIHYTRITSPTDAEYRSLVRKLCCRIDEVRGVFRNVGEAYREPADEARIFVRAIKHAESLDHLVTIVETYDHDQRGRGLYPFESLKQILGIVEKISPTSTVTPAQAKAARKAIAALWGILRAELLKELDRDFPEFPDTPYQATAGRIAARPEVAIARPRAAP